MNIEQAEQNCIKAARKWSTDIKLKHPDGEGNEPRFWVEQFGYNVFDIAFGALSDSGWHTFLRQEPDIREKLVQVTLDTAIAAWTGEQPVQRYSKEEVVEAALAHEPEPFVPSEPHKVVEPEPVKLGEAPKPIVKTAGTTAEKLINTVPTDLEQLSKTDLSRLFSLSGHAPMVLMFKGGKKYLFRDKSFIVVDVSGARAEKS
jgi:hypothetical protein